MNEDANHYEVLGIRRDADLRAIRHAHRVLVKKYHPDRCRTPGAMATFAQIQEAYEVLRDPVRRAQFDRTLEAYEEPSPPAPPQPAAPPAPPVAPAPPARRVFVQANPRRRGGAINWEFRLKVTLGLLMATGLLFFVLVPYDNNGASPAPTKPDRAKPPPPNRKAPPDPTLETAQQRAQRLRWEAELAWQTLRKKAAPEHVEARAEQVRICFQLGARAFGQRDFAEAGRQYQRILDKCTGLRPPPARGGPAPTTRPSPPPQTSLAETATGEWDQVQALDRGQGLGAKIDQVPGLLELAESARNAKHFARANEHFRKAIEACRAIRELDGRRSGARAAKESWEAALALCDIEPLMALGGPDWAAAGRHEQAARAAWKGHEFSTSREHWQKAKTFLPAAARRADLRQALESSRAHLAVGGHRLAVRLADRALQQEPWNLAALLARAEARSRMTDRLDLGDGVTVRLVRIPAGVFRMGSPPGQGYRREKPQHVVRISRPFWMSATEITQQQYQALTGTNPSQHTGLWHPVHSVSWQDATRACALASKATGRRVRLPTEAEWEYACRAGTATPYHYGFHRDQLHRYGNYDDGAKDAPTHVDGRPIRDGYRQVAPVGRYLPNAWGLYDMHGNVWEWCTDRYREQAYSESPQTDPTGPVSGESRSLRGGAWNQTTIHCRSASRRTGDPERGMQSNGFRVVVEMADQPATAPARADVR